MINAEMFAVTDDTQEETDCDAFRDTLAQLPDVWQNTEETDENMLTTWDTRLLPCPNVNTFLLKGSMSYLVLRVGTGTPRTQTFSLVAISIQSKLLML